MNKTIIFLFSLILLTSCVQSQSEKITGNPINDLPVLFETQTVSADIMDGIKHNPRQLELTKKIQSSLQNNWEWYQEYIKTVKKRESLVYHTNFGITKEEYEEFLKISKDIQVESTGKEVLEIIKEDDKIKFKANGRLSIYNDLTIDIENNQVLYKEYVLPFLDKVNIEDTDNGLKSKWKGYNWAYEYPVITDETDLTDLDNLNITIVRFTIGQLEKNGKIYMKIKERKMESGVKTVDSQIPIMF
ncbi:hypothetical protein [uncultured Aquimarina sp.]|uniref:hypothetical protein n=1 Tax=uncultured Aquimarina sp. TaxID=575652 RepID=UPI0026072A04|nr:hypothetical protein [uncultured Aquimarina sp.]